MKCLCCSFIDVEIPPKINPQDNREENYKSCCPAHSLIFEFNVTLGVHFMLLVDVVPDGSATSTRGKLAPPMAGLSGNFEQPLSPPNSAS